MLHSSTEASDPAENPVPVASTGSFATIPVQKGAEGFVLTQVTPEAVELRLKVAPGVDVAEVAPPMEVIPSPRRTAPSARAASPVFVTRDINLVSDPCRRVKTIPPRHPVIS